MPIHNTSIVHISAKVDDSAVIGPYCIVGPDVTISADVELKAHVVVDGITEIGEGTKVYPFTSLGSSPQDLKYKGEKSKLIIGKNNTIREHVTMNTGTEGGGMVTKVGDNCLFMVGCHVAHDCMIGNNVVMANNATLAGHVKVGNGVVIGGLSAVHQFVRIGNNAMIGGMSGIESDLIPYGLAKGERAGLAGLNLVGLRRKGVEKDDLNSIRAAFKVLFSESKSNFSERLEEVEAEYSNSDTVKEVISFIRSDSSRALCKPLAHNMEI